jgi:hypothetical protein
MYTFVQYNTPFVHTSVQGLSIVLSPVRMTDIQNFFLLPRSSIKLCTEKHIVFVFVQLTVNLRVRKMPRIKSYSRNLSTLKQNGGTGSVDASILVQFLLPLRCSLGAL